MSGGSYNYLCHVFGVDDLANRHSDLEAMTKRLAGLGYAKDAALETARLLAQLRQFEVNAEVAMDRLRDVWKNVEWWDSGDRGETALKQALVVYRNEVHQFEAYTASPGASQWVTEHCVHCGLTGGASIHAAVAERPAAEAGHSGTGA